MAHFTTGYQHQQQVAKSKDPAMQVVVPESHENYIKVVYVQVKSLKFKARLGCTWCQLFK